MLGSHLTKRSTCCSRHTFPCQDCAPGEPEALSAAAGPLRGARQVHFPQLELQETEDAPLGSCSCRLESHTEPQAHFTAVSSLQAPGLTTLFLATFPRSCLHSRGGPAAPTPAPGCFWSQKLSLRHVCPVSGAVSTWPRAQHAPAGGLGRVSELHLKRASALARQI